MGPDYKYTKDQMTNGTQVTHEAGGENTNTGSKTNTRRTEAFQNKTFKIKQIRKNGWNNTTAEHLLKERLTTYLKKNKNRKPMTNVYVCGTHHRVHK